MVLDSYHGNAGASTSHSLECSLDHDSKTSSLLSPRDIGRFPNYFTKLVSSDQEIESHVNVIKSHDFIGASHDVDVEPHEVEGLCDEGCHQTEYNNICASYSSAEELGGLKGCNGVFILCFDQVNSCYYTPDQQYVLWGHTGPTSHWVEAG